MEHPIGRISFAFLGIILLVSLESSFAQTNGTCNGKLHFKKTVMCYYLGEIPPDKLDPCICTHIVLAEWTMDNEFQLTHSTFENITFVERWKAQNPDLNVIISIHGNAHTENGTEWLTLASENAANFTESVLNFLQRSKSENGTELDGVELDYILSNATHKEMHVILLQAMRDAFDNATSGNTSTPEKYFLGTTITTNPEDIVRAYDLHNISRYVDMAYLPAYNFTMDNGSVVFHHSRLMGVSDMVNGDSLVDLVVSLGLSHEKLVLGVPAYGLAYTLLHANQTLPRSPSVGLTRTVSYRQICSQLSEGWHIQRDEDQTGVRAFKGTAWIGYDDPTSIRIKSKYVLLRDLAGIAVWSIDDDELTGKCGNKRFPLVTAARDTLASLQNANQKAVMDSMEEDLEVAATDEPETEESSNRRHRRSVFRVTQIVDRGGHIHMVAGDDAGRAGSLQCTRQGYFRHPDYCGQFYRCVKFDQYKDEFTIFEYDCPKSLVFDERYEVCSWASAAPPCGGSSEIFAVPRSKFICPGVGFFRDPENCRWFYKCTDFYGDGQSLTAYEFRCPSDLVFDEDNLLCNWRWLTAPCDGNYGYFRGRVASGYQYGPGAYGALYGAEYRPSFGPTVQYSTTGNDDQSGYFAARYPLGFSPSNTPRIRNFAANHQPTYGRPIVIAPGTNGYTGPTFLTGQYPYGNDTSAYGRGQAGLENRAHGSTTGYQQYHQVLSTGHLDNNENSGEFAIPAIGLGLVTSSGSGPGGYPPLPSPSYGHSPRPSPSYGHTSRPPPRGGSGGGYSSSIPDIALHGGYDKGGNGGGSPYGGVRVGPPPGTSVVLSQSIVPPEYAHGPPPPTRPQTNRFQSSYRPSGPQKHYPTTANNYEEPTRYGPSPTSTVAPRIPYGPTAVPSRPSYRGDELSRPGYVAPPLPTISTYGQSIASASPNIYSTSKQASGQRGHDSYSSPYSDYSPIGHVSSTPPTVYERPKTAVEDSTWNPITTVRNFVTYVKDGVFGAGPSSTPSYSQDSGGPRVNVYAGEDSRYGVGDGPRGSTPATLTQTYYVVNPAIPSLYVSPPYQGSTAAPPLPIRPTTYAPHRAQQAYGDYGKSIPTINYGIRQQEKVAIGGGGSPYGGSTTPTPFIPYHSSSTYGTTPAPTFPSYEGGVRIQNVGQSAYTPSGYAEKPSAGGYRPDQQLDYNEGKSTGRGHGQVNVHVYQQTGRAYNGDTGDDDDDSRESSEYAGKNRHQYHGGQQHTSYTGPRTTRPGYQSSSVGSGYGYSDPRGRQYHTSRHQSLSSSGATPGSYGNRPTSVAAGTVALYDQSTGQYGVQSAVKAYGGGIPPIPRFPVGGSFAITGAIPDRGSGPYDSKVPHKLPSFYDGGSTVQKITKPTFLTVESQSSISGGYGNDIGNGYPTTIGSSPRQYGGHPGAYVTVPKTGGQYSTIVPPSTVRTTNYGHPASSGIRQPSYTDTESYTKTLSSSGYDNQAARHYPGSGHRRPESHGRYSSSSSTQAPRPKEPSGYSSYGGSSTPPSIPLVFHSAYESYGSSTQPPVPATPTRYGHHGSSTSRPYQSVAPVLSISDAGPESYRTQPTPPARSYITSGYDSGPRGNAQAGRHSSSGTRHYQGNRNGGTSYDGRGAGGKTRYAGEKANNGDGRTVSIALITGEYGRQSAEKAYGGGVPPITVPVYFSDDGGAYRNTRRSSVSSNAGPLGGVTQPNQYSDVHSSDSHSQVTRRTVNSYNDGPGSTTPYSVQSNTGKSTYSSASNTGTTSGSGYQTGGHKVSSGNRGQVKYNRGSGYEDDDDDDGDDGSYKVRPNANKGNHAYRSSSGGNRARSTYVGPIVCDRPGLFRHPDDCSKFYECYWDRWIEKYTLHYFTCPVRLVYDGSITGCNWPAYGPGCSDNK